MILGSGSATHNLSEYFRPRAQATPEWVIAFEDWLFRAIEEGRTEDLLAYRERAPFAARNHPTPEHILPLFVALGAAGAAAGKRLHRSYDRVLAMDSFGFGA
jgi:4,5-DOPA dioxygenase extradiol